MNWSEITESINEINSLEGSLPEMDMKYTELVRDFLFFIAQLDWNGGLEISKKAEAIYYCQLPQPQGEDDE